MDAAPRSRLRRLPLQQIGTLLLILFAAWTVSYRVFDGTSQTTSAWLASGAIVVAMVGVSVAFIRIRPRVPSIERGDFGIEWSLKRLYAIFFGSFVALWAVMVALKVLLDASMVPWTWPISIVRPRVPPRVASFLRHELGGVGLGSGSALSLVYRLTPVEVVVAFLAVAVFVWFVHDVENRSVTEIYGVGFVLLLLTNLTQGFQNGYVFPIVGAGTNRQYYQVISRVTSGPEFLSRYTDIQQSLSLHASTHPPGAVLFYYYLNQVISPAEIAVVIGLLTMLSVFFVYGLVDHFYGRNAAFFSAVIFALLPSIQIYGIAAIDGVICLCFAATLYFYVRLADDDGNPYVLAALTALFLFGAMSLTYLGIFLIGVTALDQWRRHGLSAKPIAVLVAVVLPVAMVLVVVFSLTDFNYVTGFFGAYGHESADTGAAMFALVEPVNYVLTRAECIGEPILFFTPVPVALAYRSLRDSHGDPFFGLDFDAGTWLLVYAIIGYLGLLIVGAYNSAETARGAMYLFPFMTLAVGGTVARLDLGTKALKLTATLVFAQTLLMQLLGFFFW